MELDFWYFVVAAIAIFIILRVSPSLFKKKVQFQNKNVVITGGSSGIGKAIACLLVKEGANVAIMARTKSKLDEAVEEIRKYCKSPSQKVISLVCDVTDRNSVHKSMDDCISKFGTLDFAIACAGLAFPGYFLQQEVEIFEKTMSLDYFGSLYLAKEAAAQMARQKEGGHIVFVSSTLGLIGLVGYSTYVPAKYAIRGLAETLRSELKPYNIQISVVYPPDTQTPGYEEENKTKPPETVEISGSMSVADPMQVGKAVLDGIRVGDFHIAADMMTKIFAALSPGFTPRKYPILEILGLPVIGIVGLIGMFLNDQVVMKHHNLRKKQVKKDK